MRSLRKSHVRRAKPKGFDLYAASMTSLMLRLARELTTPPTSPSSNEGPGTRSEKVLDMESVRGEWVARSDKALAKVPDPPGTHGRDRIDDL
jgi:hypothetical protein